MFIVCSYLSGSIGIVRKNVTKDAVMVCICIITHTIFFIIIAPVSHYRGTPRFWAFLGLFFLWDGWQSVRSVFWECEVEFSCGEPGGGVPSALRWMAAKAEFPCGLTVGDEPRRFAVGLK